MKYFKYLLVISLISFSFGGCQFQAPDPNDSTYERGEGEGNSGY